MVRLLLICLICSIHFRVAAEEIQCSNGLAGSYPCNNINLLAFVPRTTFAAGGLNDIWGWTDTATAKEYVLLGLDNGTAFIDISDPDNPVYLGKLPTQSFNSTWRDIKVYEDHAYIVSEASGHGIQVFDLNRLANVTSPPEIFNADSVFSGVSSAHNIVINEQSGRAYAVGGNVCSGGLYTLDLQSGQNPEFVGCYSGDGYTHDAQCVTYAGPDSDYQGREICVGLNEDTVTIVDMTNPAAGELISRRSYTGSGYTHQGWFTEDQVYFLSGDEEDEQFFGHNTRTYIWDMRDLDNPVLTGFHEHGTASIDHNMYISGDRVYQANYSAGVRVLELSDLSNARLTEIGYFDTTPQDNSASFVGLWSVYPFFTNDIVAVSDRENGLFILQTDLLETDNDNDGIPDEVEITLGLDPADPEDAGLDNDSDGLSNLDEYLSGRNPLVNETLILQILFNQEE